jgi:hypothetical protein
MIGLGSLMQATAGAAQTTWAQQGAMAAQDQIVYLNQIQVIGSHNRYHGAVR